MYPMGSFALDSQRMLNFKEAEPGAGGMDQELEALTALPVQSSVPSTQVRQQIIICNSSFGDSGAFLWPLLVPTHMTYTPMHIKTKIFKYKRNGPRLVDIDYRGWHWKVTLNPDSILLCFLVHYDIRRILTPAAITASSKEAIPMLCIIHQGRLKPSKAKTNPSSLQLVLSNISYANITNVSTVRQTP